MDDDDLDDPALGSLRSVLRGMRDEEPSDRGFAALIAAARAQAEVMKPAPSWWERVLVTLRRPPVLALASAAVLVSVGLVITRHASDLDATTTAPASQAAKDTSTPAPLAGSAAPGVAPPTTGAAALPPPDTTEGAADPARAEPPRPGSAPVTPTSTDGITRDDARPRRRATGASIRPADLEDSPRSAPVPEEAKPVDAVGEAGPASTTSAVRGVLGDDAIDQGATAPVTPKRPAASAAPIQDWVTRCELAAVRGDCATVRTLARQVEAADPAVFRARLVGNRAVARCLAP